MNEPLKSFYFPHDNNAVNDIKILALREKYSWEGYGIFWGILETMSRNDGYIQHTLIGGLSLGYGVTKKWLSEYLSFCYEIGVFNMDEKGYFSNRMNKHLELRKTYINSGKKGADIRWGNRGGNRGGNSTIVKDREVKENKVKERSDLVNKFTPSSFPKIDRGIEPIGDIIKRKF